MNAEGICTKGCRKQKGHKRPNSMPSVHSRVFPRRRDDCSRVLFPRGYRSYHQGYALEEDVATLQAERTLAGCNTSSADTSTSDIQNTSATNRWSIWSQTG